MKHSIRRRIRFLEELPGGIFRFMIYSMTTAGKEVKWFMEVDRHTMECHCDCPDFRFRFANKDPLIDGVCICKHLKVARNWLARHGVILIKADEIRPCEVCDEDGAEWGLADDQGHPVEHHYICQKCVREAQGEIK